MLKCFVEAGKLSNGIVDLSNEIIYIVNTTQMVSQMTTHLTECAFNQTITMHIRGEARLNIMSTISFYCLVELALDVPIDFPRKNSNFLLLYLIYIMNNRFNECIEDIYNCSHIC